MRFGNEWYASFMAVPLLWSVDVAMSNGVKGDTSPLLAEPALLRALNQSDERDVPSESEDSDEYEVCASGGLVACTLLWLARPGCCCSSSGSASTGLCGVHAGGVQGVNVDG